MSTTKAHLKTPEILLPGGISRRRLPENFLPEDAKLFKHELEKEIPDTQLLELNNVYASSDGILFKGSRMLPQSFAFPANLEQWRRRSRWKFFSTNYLWRKKRTINDVAIWATDDWSNGYFHWLMDVLPRFYAMRNRLPELVLLLPEELKTKDFVQSTLRDFAFKSVRYIPADEVFYCRRILLPTHTAPSGHYNEALIKAVRSVLLESRTQPAETMARRVYVSRARARMRKLANEGEVINLLHDSGFETVYAEDLSFDEQVRLFADTRYLIANHGAGMTNMLFMPVGSKVLELRHHTDSINNCYFTLASALDLKYFYQTCEPADTPDPHDANLTVEIEKLQHNLKLMLEG